MADDELLDLVDEQDRVIGREALERIRREDPVKGDLPLLLNHFYGR